MSGRRAVVLGSCLAGAVLLAVAAASLLGGGPEAPPRPPVAVDPVPPRTPPRIPPRPAAEVDAPPSPGVPSDRKPWARLLLLDATTRKAVPFAGGSVVLLVPGEGPEPLLVREPCRVAADGRVEVYRAEEGGDRPLRATGETLAKAPVEIRLPGRVRRWFASREEIAGDREVLLEKSPVAVRGSVRLGKGLEGRPVAMALEPADPARDPRRPDLMPSGGSAVEGPFEWFDVPDGRWRLKVLVKAGDETAQATVEFDRAGLEVDLGEVAVRRASTLRARVVAKDGTPVLDRGIRIHDIPLGSIRLSEMFEEGGWVVFRGLPPDTELRVLAGLDDIEEKVRTPAEGGGDLKVELRWENTATRCRLRFTVEGEEPVQWGDLFESPELGKGAWKQDGRLEHDLAPGEYVLGAFARPRGKDAPVRVYATFTVPDRPLYEADIDMKERK